MAIAMGQTMAERGRERPGAGRAVDGGCPTRLIQSG